MALFACSTCQWCGYCWLGLHFGGHVLQCLSATYICTYVRVCTCAHAVSLCRVATSFRTWTSSTASIAQVRMFQYYRLHVQFVYGKVVLVFCFCFILWNTRQFLLYLLWTDRNDENENELRSLHLYVCSCLFRHSLLGLPVFCTYRFCVHRQRWIVLLG